jgi:hypothetical protein
MLYSYWSNKINLTTYMDGYVDYEAYPSEK